MFCNIIFCPVFVIQNKMKKIYFFDFGFLSEQTILESRSLEETVLSFNSMQKLFSKCFYNAYIGKS